MLAYILVPAPSIVLFVAGLFLMFMCVGAIYRLHMWHSIALSLVPTLFAVSVMLHVIHEVSLVSLAIGVLESFYVLQALLWPLLLMPLIVRQYYVYGRQYLPVVLVFVLSVVVMLLSLFFVAMPVYAAMYFVFCVSLLWVLERMYGLGASTR